ncbi:HNH endonuclease signature motif containing protein [Frankia tisae]|uniref:HNH endonuclease signature motif containing protein n=1 Tax=Frankia tisae TaxID=2950104 RepID=UPI0021BECAFB|nr:HNH endonuclease signature motif containing protein [Frankia tisae]
MIDFASLVRACQVRPSPPTEPAGDRMPSRSHPPRQTGQQDGDLGKAVCTAEQRRDLLAATTASRPPWQDEIPDGMIEEKSVGTKGLTRMPPRRRIERMFDDDPNVIPLPDLEVEVCSWAGRISTATCRWLSLIAAFDRRKGWSSTGLPTCAHWLAWRCGLGLRASYEYLRVARALQTLPQISATFARGEISFSKVRAITRIATPDTEAEWAHEAKRCSARELERLVSLQSKIKSDGGRDPGKKGDKKETIRCSWRWNEDGTFLLIARLDPERGAVIAKALEMATSSLDQPTDPRNEETITSDSTDENQARMVPVSMRADALAGVANSFLTHGAPELTDPTLYTVNVHVDVDTLIGGIESHPNDNSRSTEKGHPGNRSCEIEGGATLAPSVVRRLSCDSLLRTLLTDSKGNPLALGRTRRSPSTKLRRAIYARDKGVCRYPGCRHTRWLQVHHIKEWGIAGGATDPANLILLCSLHHRVIHDKGLILERRPTGELLVFHLDGTVTQEAPPMSSDPDPLRIFRTASPHGPGRGSSAGQAA